MCQPPGLSDSNNPTKVCKMDLLNTEETLRFERNGEKVTLSAISDLSSDPMDSAIPLDRSDSLGSDWCVRRWGLIAKRVGLFEWRI